MNNTFAEIAAIVAILAVMVGFGGWMSEIASKNDEAFRVACVGRGGVVLEDTRVTGKIVSVSRTCIKSDALIDVEGKSDE